MSLGQWALVAFALLIIGGGAVAMNKSDPRGIRNNNPGNIRRGQRWQGLAAKQNDADFATFVSPAYGLRALAKVLQTYQVKYGLTTIREVISRWAPSSENDTESYIQSVSTHVGASPDAPLDFSRKVVLIPMMEAITKHENGIQPYSYSVFSEGVRLSGVV